MPKPDKYCWMNTFFQIAFKNLFRKKIRTLMTVLGVGVGIGIFVSLISITESLQAQVRALMRGYHFDITIHERGIAQPFSSNIDDDQVQRLLGIKGISGISSIVMGDKRTKWNPFAIIIGVSPEDRIFSQVSLVEGRAFAPGKKEAIIGVLLAEKLGLALNDMLRISKTEYYKITGISRLGSRLLDNAIVLSQEKAQEILKRKDNTNILIAYADEQEKIDQLVATINHNFPKLIAQKGIDFISRMSVFVAADAFLIAVSFISISSCCFIIINTLLMAIAERTKEIGILMAIGWSRTMIMTTIAFESLMICFFGYLAGGMLGTFFLWILNHRNLVTLGSIPVYPVMDTMLSAFYISILLGILSTVYPGIVATRMLPVKALMHE
jgi:putative ABC transport system permease protein